MFVFQKFNPIFATTNKFKMDIKDKRSLKRRLMYIYIGYFVILTLGFFHSFVPSLAATLRLGIREISTLQQQIKSGEMEDYVWYVIPVKPAIFDETCNEVETIIPENKITSSMYEGFMNIHLSKTHTPQHILDKLSNMSTFDNIIALLIGPFQLIVFIFIALIINSLRKSIRDQRPLSKCNIVYMRLIGVLVIVIALLEAASYSINNKIVTMLATEHYAQAFKNVFPIEYGELVMGLLIIFAAEVFVIGTKLSEEQEYTI